MKSVFVALRNGVMLVKGFFQEITPRLSSMMPLYCVGRCCLAPSALIAATLVFCLVVGCTVCRFSTEHVGFDLLVAIGAVVVHHATTDIIRRVRAWKRQNGE